MLSLEALSLSLVLLAEQLELLNDLFEPAAFDLQFAALFLFVLSLRVVIVHVPDLLFRVWGHRLEEVLVHLVYLLASGGVLVGTDRVDGAEHQLLLLNS